MESSEQIEKFQGFVESTYSKDLAEAVEKGHRCLNLDFQELMRYDVELAEALLNSPEDLIQAAEIAISQFDFVKSNIRARFKNLPESQYVAVRDIRSKHLSKFISIEGIVRQASDVRPQVVTAKFECPSCGNTISVLQLDSRFKEPFRCSCGRKGKFKLLSKDLVDAQRLVVEEAPENLEGGEQPKRLSVFLKEDLVEPKMEKKTTPGSKILVMGVVKEVPIILSTGAQSTRYDLAMDANFIEPIHEDFSEVNLSPEDIVRIKSLFETIKVKKSSPKLESTLNKTIKSTTSEIENFRYNFAVINLREILESLESEKEASKDTLEKFLKLLHPFCPHITEELWSNFNKSFISLAEWPKVDESKINEKFDQAEKSQEKTLADIQNILRIVREKSKKEPKSIYLYTIPKELSNYNPELLSKKLQIPVKVFANNDKSKIDPQNKAQKASPGRPAIYIE